MTVLGIDHAGITVASIEAALGFYRDLLGLRVTGEGEDEGAELDAITGLSGVRIRYAELELGDGQLLEVIEYVPPARADAARSTSVRAGASHLALRVDDVDALCERLAAAGVAVAGAADDDHRARAPGTACAASTSRIPTAAASSSSSARNSPIRAVDGRSASGARVEAS